MVENMTVIMMEIKNYDKMLFIGLKSVALERWCNFEPESWSSFSSIFVTYFLSLAAKLATIFRVVSSLA